MHTTAPLFTCATCEDAITYRPTFHVGLAFCCAGCAADGPCRCSYDEEVIDDDARVSSHAAAVARPLDTADAGLDRSLDQRWRGADDARRLVGAAG